MRCVGFGGCPCEACRARRYAANMSHPFHPGQDPGDCEPCTRRAREAAAELGRAVAPGTCEHDTGSATGCRPACDAPATRVVTYGGYGGPYVTRLCDRHADRLPGRIWPDTVTDDAPAGARREVTR